jgi:ribonuclease-3 family protein
MYEKLNGANLPGAGALSYLGDACHSLYVRRMLIEKGIAKSADLNREALKYVTAEAQARMYREIADSLTEFEKDVFRRASNSTHLNKPKHASGVDYRYASGFEAVLGMLFWVGDEERLKFILDLSHKNITEKKNDTED